MAGARLPTEPTNVTLLLQRLSEGDGSVANELATIVYDELYRIADRAMRSERTGHTLQPTLLVNDAFLRLVGQHSTHWQNRSHFYALAAQAIRRILIDHTRARQRRKRDFGLRVTLTHSIAQAHSADIDALAVNEALDRLEAVAPRPAKIAELRYYGGLEIEEVARVLDISAATVKRDWTFARAFLLRELQQQER